MAHITRVRVYGLTLGTSAYNFNSRISYISNLNQRATLDNARFLRLAFMAHITRVRVYGLILGTSAYNFNSRIFSISNTRFHGSVMRMLSHMIPHTKVE